jgi:hypothetical protein
MYHSCITSRKSIGETYLGGPETAYDLDEFARRQFYCSSLPVSRYSQPRDDNCLLGSPMELRGGNRTPRQPKPPSAKPQLHPQDVLKFEVALVAVSEDRF